MTQSTITVNGKLYDAVTGLLIGNQPANDEAEKPQVSRKPASSHNVHRRVEQSRATNRRAQTVHAIQKRPQTRPAPRTAPTRSPQLTKFAPAAPATAPQRQPRVVSDITPPTQHPIVKKIEPRMQPAQPKAEQPNPAMKPAAVLKKEAIDEALAKAPNHTAPKAAKRQKRAPRMLSFASVALSLLLLAGYFTYINLPNLSIRVAAAQAGISASYPSYKPDGYRMAGVNYDKGSVSVTFAANAGPHTYTVTQQQTSWDSTAVKENYVTPNWGDNVVPYSERGLTIYAHNGNAAWVNGGIFYTISGDAPLSASQVRGIATSL